MKKRLKWIDILKGYLMLMVIFSHIEFHPYGIMEYFGPVFLTGFFFTAGYTFNAKNNFKEFVTGKVIALLIPWFLLASINIFATKIITFNEKISLRQQFIDLLLQKGTGGNILWFIAAMFLSCLIFYFLFIILYKKNPLLLIGVLFILIVINFIFSKYGIFQNLYWHLNVIPDACFWMAIGKVFKEYGCKMISFFVKYKYKLLIFNITIYILIIRFVLKNKYISIRDYGNSLFLYFLVSFIGILIMINLSIATERIKVANKFLIFTGCNSMLYLGFHGKIYSVLNLIFYKIIKIMQVEELSYIFILITSIIFVLLIVLILIYPIKFINKYIPILAGEGYKWKKT